MLKRRVHPSRFCLSCRPGSKHRFIHERFAHSLWNALGMIWFERYGSKKPEGKAKRDSFCPDGSLTGSRMRVAVLYWKFWRLLKSPEEKFDQVCRTIGRGTGAVLGRATPGLSWPMSFPFGDLAKLLFLESSCKLDFAGEGLPANTFAETERLQNHLCP